MISMKRRERIAEPTAIHRKKLVALAIGAMTTTGVAQAQLEEIVVTATKRAESSQDIPVAIQAITGDSLTELGITTFDEYVQYLPNVVQQSRGPGRSEIYIRGVATEQSNNTVSSVQGSAPAVALYVDEQVVAFGGRNLDFYAADLERVEVLPGPQGTLFGASSQSGTVRLITNKPSTEGFSGKVSAGYSFTTGGDPSTDIEATLNVPLSDTVAIRGTVYSDTQGGWIDNAPTAFDNSDRELINVINRNQISGAAAILPDAQLPETTNTAVVEDDWNDAQYQGARLGISWDINDNWNALLQHTTQDLETEGSFEYAPTTGTVDQSQSFSPDRNNDNFDLTTWTLTGRIGALDVLYTGGFLSRDVDSVIDYTTYSFGGGYQVYYISTGGYSTGSQVFDYTKQFVETTQSERTSHEIRIQGEIGERFRFTAGGFFDDVETNSQGAFQYLGAVDAGFDVAVTPGNGFVAGVNDPTGRGATTIFINDFTRDEDQTAFFADVSFDITDRFTVSAGVRDYDLDFALTGSTGSSFGCKGVDPFSLPAAGTPGATTVAQVRPDGTLGCDGNAFDNNVTTRVQALGDGSIGALTERFGSTGNTSGPALAEDIANGSLNVAGLNPNGVANQSDTIFRFTLDYKLSDDVLLFATFSEGFRPQTVNRNAGQASANQSGPFEGFRVTPVAETDELTNFEIGIKGDFFDNRLRLNATYYNSEIDNLQTTRFDPSNVAFLVFIENVGDAEVQGLDADFTWVPTDALTISGAFALVDSEITSLNEQLVGIAAPVGSELPFTADFSFNLRARYDFPLASFGADAFVQLSLIHI